MKLSVTRGLESLLTFAAWPFFALGIVVGFIAQAVELGIKSGRSVLGDDE